MRSNGFGPVMRPLGQGSAMNAAVKIARGCSILMVLALLSGCAEPRLDASSQERALASAATLRGKLAGEDLAEFDSLMSEAVASSTQSDKKQSLADALIIYNGMTGGEIVEKHRKLREARVAVQATKDQELFSRMREIKAQISELKKVHISEATIEEAHDRLFMYASINNGLPHTITSLKVHFELRTQGRELAWISGETTFYIPGGIESGELVRDHTPEEWQYIPARKRKKEHPEAEFNFFVKEVVRSDGTTVPNLDGITDDDWARFAEMQSETGAEKTDPNSSTQKE